MRSPMDEKTFLSFYRSTVLGCSKAVHNHICSLLENEHRIVFNVQTSLDDREDAMYFENRRDQQKIVSETAMDSRFSAFYEKWEFSKLYKYSVPLFFSAPEAYSIVNVLEANGIVRFDEENFSPAMVLHTTIKEAKPLFWDNGKDVFIKFVLQKSYFMPESYERVDYRYPVVLYVNEKRSIIDIRYDAVKYSSDDTITSNSYETLVNDCIGWLQRTLGLDLYRCEHQDFIQTINDRSNAEVTIFKQMMELSSGGSAELTASVSTDYILPFIGELKELIEENAELFDESEDVKRLLLNYLKDKEETTNYPYIYVKWVKPVETQSYIVKVTFDYFGQKYTLLQHITGICKDLGMGRMNDAIRYLCEHSSFVRGEKI